MKFIKYQLVINRGKFQRRKIASMGLDEEIDTYKTGRENLTEVMKFITKT